MDKLHEYINYSSDDFVEDSFFWKWVLEKDKVATVIWQEFIQKNPGKKEVIEKAIEKVLQLNTERHRLSAERVSSLWARIQQSKNEITMLDLRESKTGSMATLVLNSPQTLDIAIFVLTLYLSLLLS